MAKAKIVIIDDEELSILGLKVLLEKIEPANQIVAQFTSSLRALEYLMNNPVDIVITDINMPKLNGLALIKKIREIDQSIQMIVLTGYGSLDYATEAMRYEVKFFLQKPCQLHELELAIQTSLEKIKVTKKNTLLFRKQKIDQVLLGEFVADKEVGPFLLLLYREYYYNDFHNKIASILYQQEIEYVISTINGMLAYFIFSEERVIGGLKKELLFNIQKKAIIYYSYHQNLERLTHSVLKGSESLDYTFFFQEFRFIRESELPERETLATFFQRITDDFYLMKDSFEMHNFDDVSLRLELLFKDIGKTLIPVSILMDLWIYQLKKLLSGLNLDTNVFNKLIKEIHGVKILNDLKERTMELVTEIQCKIVEVELEGNISSSLNQIIETHYHNKELSLRWVSKNLLFLNPEYLGKVYFKETNQKFTQRLLEVRMVKASELLQRGYKVYEVAEMVGYGDAADYFGKQFKKLYKMTPKQYSNNLFQTNSE